MGISGTRRYHGVEQGNIGQVRLVYRTAGLVLLDTMIRGYDIHDIWGMTS